MRFGKVSKKEEHEILTGRMAKDPVEKTLKKTGGGGSSSSKNKEKEKHAESPRGRSRTPKEGGHKSSNSSKSSRKKGSKSRSKSKSSRDERSSSGRRAADFQVIDRIPTAVDYHSVDSEDEWLEQKSKCSRYQLEEDQDQFTDEERESEREPPEMNDDDEPEEDAGDRYSMKKEKKNDPTAIAVEELLREESFDSNMRMRERLMLDVEQESKLTSSTPIYDSPLNKKKSKEKTKDHSKSKPKGRSSSKSSKKKVESSKSKKTRSSSKTREEKKSSTSRPETKSSKSLKGRRSPPSSSSKQHSLSSSSKTRSSSKSKKRGSSIGSSTGSRKRLEQPADEVSAKLSSSDLSPTAASDTSSLTDPLHTMLNYTATDKVVREIEQKLKLLKQTAAKEKAEAERAARKRSKSKDRHHSKKKTVETSSRQKYRGKKIPVVTTPTPQSLPSPKDEVEMMRSDSTENKDMEVKEMPSKETAKSDTKRDEDVPPTQQESDERALKSQKSDSSGVAFAKLFSKTKISVAKRDDGNDPKTEQVAAGVEGTNWNSMYTKALFTAEDSMVDKSAISGSGLPSEDIKAPPKKSNTSETERYNPVELKKTRSWFGRQKKEKKTSHKKLPTRKIGRKQRSKSNVLWRKRSSTRIVDETENVSTAKPLAKTASASSKSHSSKSQSSKEDEDSRLQRITPLVEAKKQKNNLVRELDEYSVTQGNTDEPGVVQCLKFYSCGALANNVNVAIQAVSCQGPAIQAEDEEDGILQTIPTTPQPAVEVVLDEILHPQQQTVNEHKHEHGRGIGRSILSCGGSGSWEDAVSTSASVIVDVTEKQLHLDSGSVVEERQKQPPAPVEYVAEEPNRSRSGVSITSVHVPSQTTKTKKIKNSKKEKGESKKKVKTQSRDAVVRKAETETDDGEEETTEHDDEGNEPPLDATMVANVKGPLRKLVRRFRKK